MEPIAHVYVKDTPSGPQQDSFWPISILADYVVGG